MEIKSARSFNKNGKELVCFNGNIVLSVAQVANATGIKSFHHVLVGGNIDATFYKTGDTMLNEAKCTKDNMIVKDFAIELPARLFNYVMAAATGAVIAA